MANHNDGMCPGFQNRVGVTRWHVPCAFFRTDPLNEAQPMLDGCFDLLSPVGSWAPTHGWSQPTWFFQTTGKGDAARLP